MAAVEVEVELERVQREALCLALVLAFVLAVVIAFAQPLLCLFLVLRPARVPALPQLLEFEQDPVQRVLDGRRLVQGLAVAGAERERRRGLPLGLRFSSFFVVLSVSLRHIT